MFIDLLSLQISDCQNRFSTSATNNDVTKPSTSTDTNSSNAKRKIFENGTYETFQQSIYSTVRTCYQTKCDVDTTHRKILETARVGLIKIVNQLEANEKKK